MSMIKQKSKNHSKHPTQTTPLIINATTQLGQLEQQLGVSGGQPQPKKLMSKNTRSKGNLKKQNTNGSQTSTQSNNYNNSAAPKLTNNNANIIQNSSGIGNITNQNQNQSAMSGQAVTIEVDLRNRQYDANKSNSSAASSGSVTQKNKPVYTYQIESSPKLTEHSKSYQQQPLPIFTQQSQSVVVQQVDLKQLNNYTNNNKKQSNTSVTTMDAGNKSSANTNQINFTQKQQQQQQQNTMMSSRSNQNISVGSSNSQSNNNYIQNQHQQRPNKNSSQSLVNVSYQPTAAKKSQQKSSTSSKIGSGVKSFTYQQQVQQIQNKHQNQQVVSNFNQNNTADFGRQSNSSQTNNNLNKQISLLDSSPKSPLQIQEQNSFTISQQCMLQKNESSTNSQVDNQSCDLTRQISQASSREDSEFVMINGPDMMIESQYDLAMKQSLKGVANNKVLVNLSNDNIQDDVNQRSDYKTSQNEDLMRLIHNTNKNQTTKSQIQNLQQQSQIEALQSQHQFQTSQQVAKGVSNDLQKSSYKSNLNRPQIFSPQPIEKIQQIQLTSGQGNQNSQVYLLNHLSPHSSFKQLTASTTTHKTSSQNFNNHSYLNNHLTHQDSQRNNNTNLNNSYGMANSTSLSANQQQDREVRSGQHLVSNFTQHASSPQPVRRGTAAILSKEPSLNKNPTINSNYSQRNFQNNELNKSQYSHSYQQPTSKQSLSQSQFQQQQQQPTSQYHQTQQPQQKKQSLGGMQRSQAFGQVIGSGSGVIVAQNISQDSRRGGINEIQLNSNNSKYGYDQNSESQREHNNSMGNGSESGGNSGLNKSQNIANNYYKGSQIVSSTKQVRPQNKSQSLNNYGNIGNLKQKSDIIGRELTVQSFRDKDQNQLKHQISNPFEVNDTLIEQEVIFHNNTQRQTYQNNYQPQSFQSGYIKGQIRQPIETQRYQYNHNNIKSMSGLDQQQYQNQLIEDNYFRQNNQPYLPLVSNSDQLQNQLTQFGGVGDQSQNIHQVSKSYQNSIVHSTKNSQSESRSILKVQSEPQNNVFKSKFNENINNRNQILNQFNASTRPDEPSSNKYSRTQQLENVQDDPNEDFLTDNDNEGSNTQGGRSGSGGLSGKRIFKSAERSFRLQNNVGEYMFQNAVAVNHGQGTSGYENMSPNIDKPSREFYNQRYSGTTDNDTEQLDTVRRGVSQMPGSSQLLNMSKLESLNAENFLNNSQGQIKINTNEERGFSISNIKNSLFSKISNIFNKEELQQQLDLNSKPKEPKFFCTCGQHPIYPYLCKEAYNWYARYNKTSLQDYKKLKSTYQELLKQEVEKETENQIQRDLNRTFPNHEYFKEGSEGVEKLRRVLTAFANYDHQVDYVQGMNFIVASLLFHANEVMSFWLFVSLIEDCELRDIYMHGLPGLFKHSQIIDMLIMENLHQVFSHFCLHNLKVEMYASDWIFGLFASVIPLEKMSAFFSKFYQYKWIFFYKLILSILKFLEEELLQEDELWNILNQIKSQTHLNTAAISGQSSALKNSRKKRNKNRQNNENSNTTLTYEETPQSNKLSIKQSDNLLDVKNQGSRSNQRLDSDSDSDSDDQSNQGTKEGGGKVVSFFKKLFQKQEQDMWLMLIDNSMKEWKFNEGEINKMLHTWDPEKNTFTQD
eukprot:403373845